MNITCDILVVGAGPSGSMAAKTASEKNTNVLLIERNKNIGSPVRCAEGINKFLFQDTGIKKNKSYINQEIKGTKIYFYNEIYELNSEQWKGYTIDRKKFDPYLAKLAEKSGAKLLTETKAIGMKRKGNRWVVNVKTKEKIGHIEAKIVIGADGFECNIGRWVGIRSKWKKDEICKCYELLLDCPDLKEDNKFHIAFGKEFPNGYGWIFPKKKKANVGVGVSINASPKNALKFFIEEYPRISTILGEKRSIIEKRGGSIPMSGPKSTNETISDGIILVGDAAGMVDPITGEGITFSMISGISAGEVATLSIEKNNWTKNALNKYEETWRSKKYLGDVSIGEDMELLKQTKELFYKIFTQKDIAYDVRKKLILIMMMKNKNEIERSITKIQQMIK